MATTGARIALSATLDFVEMKSPAASGLSANQIPTFIGPRFRELRTTRAWWPGRPSAQWRLFDRMSRGAHKFKQGDVTKAIKGAVNAGLSVKRIEIQEGKIICLRWPSRRSRAGQRMGRRAVKSGKTRNTRTSLPTTTGSPATIFGCRAGSGCRYRAPWSPIHGGPREGARRRLGGTATRRQPDQGRYRKRRHRVLLPIERFQGWAGEKLAENAPGDPGALPGGSRRQAHRSHAQEGAADDPEQENTGRSIELAEGTCAASSTIACPST